MGRRAIEDDFRAAVRGLIGQGKHPDHAAVRAALGVGGWGVRSGLTIQQTRWRIEEVERAGYDWSASKRAGRLVKRGLSEAR